MQDTRRSHPDLRRQLLERRSRAQSALANYHLMRGDVAAARSVLKRTARQHPRPRFLIKFLWALAAPASLRREVARRNDLTAA